MPKGKTLDTDEIENLSDKKRYSRAKGNLRVSVSDKTILANKLAEAAAADPENAKLAFRAAASADRLAEAWVRIEAFEGFEDESEAIEYAEGLAPIQVEKMPAELCKKAAPKPKRVNKSAVKQEIIEDVALARPKAKKRARKPLTAAQKEARNEKARQARAAKRAAAQA